MMVFAAVKTKLLQENTILSRSQTRDSGVYWAQRSSAGARHALPCAAMMGCDSPDSVFRGAGPMVDVETFELVACRRDDRGVEVGWLRLQRGGANGKRSGGE